ELSFPGLERRVHHHGADNLYGAEGSATDSRERKPDSRYYARRSSFLSHARGRGPSLRRRTKTRLSSRNRRRQSEQHGAHHLAGGPVSSPAGARKERWVASVSRDFGAI